MLTVIIPAYNRAKHLPHAVKSIIHQSIKDIEIIIIDDGSTDSTPQLCEKLQSQYSCIRVIRQNNQGVSAARNTGIKNAKGQYLLFLDSDDFIVDGVLDLEFSEALKQQKADIFMFSSLGANSRKNRFCIEQRYPDRFFVGKQNFSFAGHFGSCIYKRQLLIENDIWFDEGVSLNEDQVFKFKALYMADIIQTFSKFCYVYCNNPQSIVHTMKRRIDFVTAWQCAYKWFQEHVTGPDQNRILSYVQFKINSRTLLYAKNYVQLGHSAADLEKELMEQNCYSLLENLTPSEVMPYQAEELRMFQTDRALFVRKAKMEGVKVSVGRLVLRIPFVRKWRDKRRYPSTEIPM